MFHHKLKHQLTPTTSVSLLHCCAGSYARVCCYAILHLDDVPHTVIVRDHRHDDDDNEPTMSTQRTVQTQFSALTRALATDVAYALPKWIIRTTTHSGPRCGREFTTQQTQLYIQID